MSNFLIKKLKINWYGHLSFKGVAEFKSGVNILLGKNGSGKTSILNLLNRASRQEKPSGNPDIDPFVIKNDDGYHARITIDAGGEENDHIDFVKVNNVWQGTNIYTPEKIRYVTSKRTIKNELSVNSILKVSEFNIPEPGTDINISDEFNKAIISEMIEKIKILREEDFTTNIEEEYRKGLIDFEKDIRIDFDRDNPVYFVDDKMREVSILDLSEGEKEYLYFYAYLRRIRTDQNKIILIDEPELHLHGNQIRKLCELISKLSEVNQVIIATHSSDILHHFYKTANIVLVEKGKLSNPKLGQELSEAIDELGIPIDPSFFTAHWICAENKDLKLISGDNSPNTSEVLSWIFGTDRNRRYWSFGGSRVNIESSLELFQKASGSKSDAKLSVILDGDKLSFIDAPFPPEINSIIKNTSLLHFPFWELENIFLNPKLLDVIVETKDGKSGNEIVWESLNRQSEVLFKSYFKTTLRNSVRLLWRDNYFQNSPIEDLEKWKKDALSLKVDDSIIRQNFQKIIKSKNWFWIPGKESLKLVLKISPDFWLKVQKIVSKDLKEFSQLISCEELKKLQNIINNFVKYEEEN